MKRIRAVAVVALGLLGPAAQADDTEWKSAPGTSKPAAPPVQPTRAAVPASAVVPAAPPAEQSPWVPADRTRVDPGQHQESTPTTPMTAPAPVPPPAVDPGFQSVITTPIVTTPPAAPPAPPVILPVLSQPPADIPTTLPAPAVRLPQVAATDLPGVQVPKLPDVKLPTDPLPTPRPVDPSVKPPQAVQGLSGVNPVCNGPCEPIPAGLLEPAPGGTYSAPPVRNHVFGSKPINLSRDYRVRDMLGTDILTPEREGGVLRGGDLDPSGPPEDNYFLQAEYLLSYVNRARIPALATTSASVTGTGILGNADTRNLLGPGNFGPGFHDGFRIRGGGWLDECGTLGADASFFFLGKRGERAEYGSDQFPVLTRPFFAPNAALVQTQGGAVVGLPGEFGEIVAAPGVSTGRLVVDTDSYLWGADANFRRAICRTCTGGYGWYAGFRHLNLSEQLTVTEFITASAANGADPAGTQVVVQDRFRTANRFYGGQVGGQWDHRWGRWDVDARASVALGVTHQVVTIDGFQQRTRPGEATQSFTGGLLAVGPNLGRFTKDRFSVSTEATVNVGWMASDSIRLYVGYNFLYWSNVVRPGDQIDRTVDVTFVPNPPAGVPASGQNRPLPTFRQADLFTNGIQFGAEVRW